MGLGWLAQSSGYQRLFSGLSPRPLLSQQSLSASQRLRPGWRWVLISENFAWSACTRFLYRTFKSVTFMPGKLIRFFCWLIYTWRRSSLPYQCDLLCWNVRVCVWSLKIWVRWLSKHSPLFSARSRDVGLATNVLGHIQNKPRLKQLLQHSE